MSKPVIYLHIGPHRTGTTQIQVNLHRNRRALNQRQFLYPKSGLYIYGHHHLVGDINNHVWYDKSLGGLDALKAEIGEKRKNIIISSETFGDIKTRRPLRELKRAFSPRFDFKIIPYLRAQEDRLLSHWNAEIRMALTNFPFETWAGINMPNIMSLDYNKWLSLFSDVFGDDAMMPQLYQAQDPKLFKSFLALIGIDDLSDFTLHNDPNQSIPALHAEIYRQLTMPAPLDPVKDKARLRKISTDKSAKHAFEQELHGVINPMKNSREIIREFLEDRQIDQSGSLYPPRLIKAVRDHFRAGNQQVSDKYFGGKPLFPCLPDHRYIGGNVFAKISKADIAELSCRLLTAYRQSKMEVALAALDDKQT